MLGRQAQSRLRRLSIAVVGLGGVGQALSQQLVMLGVGELLLIDPQLTTPDNFNRIPTMTLADIGRPKVYALASRLRRRAHLTVNAVVAPVESSQIQRQLRHVDAICCCANTVTSRRAAAGAAVAGKKYYVSAGVADGRVARIGQVLTWGPEQAHLACDGCFLAVASEANVTTTPGVVLPTVASVVASLAAHLLLIRFTAGFEQQRQFNLLNFDLDSWAVEPLLVQANPACELGQHR